MANYIDSFPDTEKTWQSSGGTYAITLHNIANNVGREGAKGDFYHATYGYPSYLEWWLEWSAGSTPTAGLVVEGWVGESNHATAGTNNPGTLTGADAAVSNIDTYKYQLTKIGSLLLYAATAVQKTSLGITIPKRRYQIPVIINYSGQTSTNTAGNFVLRCTPWYRRVN